MFIANSLHPKTLLDEVWLEYVKWPSFARILVKQAWHSQEYHACLFATTWQPNILFSLPGNKDSLCLSQSGFLGSEQLDD